MEIIVIPLTNFVFFFFLFLVRLSNKKEEKVLIQRAFLLCMKVGFLIPNFKNIKIFFVHGGTYIHLKYEIYIPSKRKMMMID